MWQHRSSPLREAKPGALGHMAAPELTLSGRQGLKLRDTWQHQRSPCQGGKVRSWGTRGSAGAHLDKEARSGAMGHVAAPKPTSVGRFGLKLQRTWQHVDARPAPCLDLELICGGTLSSRY
jgi:hypothetical protein